MKTLILKIDNAINASKIYKVVKLFKGVKHAYIVSSVEGNNILHENFKSNDKEDLKLFAAIKEGCTGKYLNTEEFLKKLRI